MYVEKYCSLETDLFVARIWFFSPLEFWSFCCQVNFAKEFEFRAEESSMEQAEREICRTLRWRNCWAVYIIPKGTFFHYLFSHTSLEGLKLFFVLPPNPPQLNFWGRIFNDWNFCTRLKDCQAWYVNDQNLCKKRELIATDATELAGYLRSGFNSVGIWCFCTLSPLSCKLVLNSGMTQSTRWLECFLKRSQWTKAGLLMLERWRDNKIIEFMQNTLWIGRN